jgi:M6 family metalloprotease-like protein
MLLLISGCGGGGSDSSSDADISDPIPAALPVTAEEPAISNGSLPLLVIRLAYSDRSFVNDAATWHDKIFGETPHQLNDYYLEVSNGNFRFIPAEEGQGSADDGVITVTLDKPHPDPDDSRLMRSDLAAALAAADPYIDYSIYDRNGNGGISFDEMQIMFIVAGYEDAYSGGSSAPGVWAHSYCLSSSGAPRADGVSLLECTYAGRYALFGERHGNHDATIGIIAHELGHSAFMLPDLYDTDGSSSGIGYFGLMAMGSWGTSHYDSLTGETPTHFSAWSKLRNGWVTPVNLAITPSEGVSVSLYQSSSIASNIIKIPISENEYFLLENRDNGGYDRGLDKLGGTFDGGLALWHIDETVIASRSATNSVNTNETRKGVDLEEAARVQLDSGSGNGHERNLYYAGNVADFTPTTDPDSDSYTGSGSGIYIEGISDRGAIMYATIINPN